MTIWHLCIANLGPTPSPSPWILCGVLSSSPVIANLGPTFYDNHIFLTLTDPSIIRDFPNPNPNPNPSPHPK